MNRLQELNRLGQSMWYDNIRRSLIDNGELQALIDAGISGITSNPTIFEKAIGHSSDYDDELLQLVDSELSDGEIYETLALADIRRAADLLRPVYERTGGADGYISLEVSPALANDTVVTTKEAARLFAALDRPNVMIKIPATPAGLPAITASIAAGINVNVTLIFALDQYEAVAEAYIAGLEQLHAAGRDLAKVASVASFFVSRVDTKVDKALDALADKPAAAELRGTIAIANAKVAYERFQAIFSGPRWERLAAASARVQRPLWASTGTKDPRYADTIYVDTLIGPDTVNTAPPQTVDAFRDHGSVAPTLTADVATAHNQLAQLAALGIDLQAVTDELLAAGVASFAASFDDLMQGLAAKRQQLLAEKV